MHEILVFSFGFIAGLIVYHYWPQEKALIEREWDSAKGEFVDKVVGK